MDFLDFLWISILASGKSDKSKPIERTLKGFVTAMGMGLLGIAMMGGIIAILFYRQYILGIVAICASAMITFIWYRLYRRYHKAG